MFILALSEGSWIAITVFAVGLVYAVISEWKKKSEKSDTQSYIKEELKPVLEELKEKDEKITQLTTNLQIIENNVKGIYKRLESFHDQIEKGFDRQADQTKDNFTDIKKFIETEFQYIRGRIQHLYDTKQEKD